MIFKVSMKENLESLHLEFEKICKIILVKSCNPRLENFTLITFERKKERKKVFVKIVIVK